jgi:hypothetical protein
VYILAKETFDLERRTPIEELGDRILRARIENQPHYAETVQTETDVQYVKIGNYEQDVSFTFSPDKKGFRISIYTPSTLLEKMTLPERGEDHTHHNTLIATRIILRAQELLDMNLYRSKNIVYPIDVYASEIEIQDITTLFRNAESQRSSARVAFLYSSTAG